MSIDKSWIKLKNRASDTYWIGMLQFLDIASRHLNSNIIVKCSCKRCISKEHHTLDVLEAHIMDYDFHPFYTTWIWHGEDEVYKTSLVEPSSSSQPEDGDG